MRKNDGAFDAAALRKIEEIFDAGGRLGAAVSGGADSVFLLFALLDRFEGARDSITVLHFNHRARAAADADEKFVKALSKDLGLKCVCGRAKERPKKISEELLREGRMEFFRRCAARHKLSAVAQGHHMGDVAETALMRLMRGSGAQGLCAPRPVSETPGLLFLRPLLAMKKREICEVLRESSIAWREDESNEKCDFLRNALRNDVIPALKKLSRCDFEKSAARSRALLQEDADALDAVLEAELAKRPRLSKNSLPVTELVAGQKALARRAVFALIKKAGLPLPARAAEVDALVSGITENLDAKMSLGGAFIVYDARGLELFAAPAKPEAFEKKLKAGLNILPDGSAIRLEKLAVGKALFAEISSGKIPHAQCAYLNCDFPKDSLKAREVRAEDSYAPIGRSAPRRVFAMLAEQKTHKMKRFCLPLVLINGAQPAWAAACPPADAFRLRRPGRAIKLTYLP